MGELKLFKIRRKSDGKFSTGGAIPKFTSIGKLWRKQHLNSHLIMLKWSRRDSNIIEKIYSNCEVVTFNIFEDGVEDMNEYTTSNIKL